MSVFFHQGCEIRLIVTRINRITHMRNQKNTFRIFHSHIYGKKLYKPVFVCTGRVNNILFRVHSCPYYLCIYTILY